jgi:uncharacterized protein with GYD domain
MAEFVRVASANEIAPGQARLVNVRGKEIALFNIEGNFFALESWFTDQGIRNVKETVSRAEAFKEMAKKSGVTVKDMYWTLGRYDVIAICEAPDDEAATALSLSVCSRGNVRSETLRAFSFDEMKTILDKMV